MKKSRIILINTKLTKTACTYRKVSNLLGLPENTESSCLKLKFIIRNLRNRFFSTFDSTNFEIIGKKSHF